MATTSATNTDTDTDSTYTRTLATARTLGAAKASDTGLIALFCASPSLHQLCGAVVPSRVFDGAYTTGLTYREFMHLVAKDPAAVADLMWA